MKKSKTENNSDSDICIRVPLVEFEELIKKSVKSALDDRENERYISRAEVCEILKISRYTVKRLVDSGKLNEIRIGNARPRYLLADILNYKQNKE